MLYVYLHESSCLHAYVILLAQYKCTCYRLSDRKSPLAQLPCTVHTRGRERGGGGWRGKERGNGVRGRWRTRGEKKAHGRGRGGEWQGKGWRRMVGEGSEGKGRGLETGKVIGREA